MSNDKPFPTAYRPCVGLLVLNRAGHIWIGERIEARNDAEGLGTWWQMPQGGIDAGEDPETAVKSPATVMRARRFVPLVSMVIDPSL